MSTVTKPLIIVGTGRCGSTVFHRLLAKHPQIMWLSGLCDRFPTHPAWNRRVVSALAHPFMRRLAGSKLQPDECYRFWESIAFGFSEPCRDLVSTDVTPRVKRQVLETMGRMLSSRRDRLLIKITGWPRIGFLAEIFEDAKFIHLVRDGRAVANSLLHVDFWRGWRGPQGWRAGLLSPEDEATWEQYDRSFVALAALEWRIQMRAMEAARRSVASSRFLEIKYETLCDQPLDTIRRVLEYAELPTSSGFERAIEATPVKSANNRWREGLTHDQQCILDEILRDDLVRYGYEASVAGRPVQRAVS